MAKFYNNRVKTGRVAGSVFAIRNGETIERAYQPIVSNPKSTAQVGSRAKLKLLSQLSAVMASVIAIPRQGGVSSRNLFTKVNYPLTTFSDDTANIELANVQLTKSVVALPAIDALRTEAGIVASLSSAAGLGSVDVNRVVYCLFDKQGDNKLRYVASRIATEPSADNDWKVRNLPLINDAAVVLAYGIRDNTENARVVFGNMTAPVAETVAKIVTSRTLDETDVTLTETRGYELSAVSREITDEVTKSKKENKS